MYIITIVVTYHTGSLLVATFSDSKFWRLQRDPAVDQHVLKPSRISLASAVLPHAVSSSPPTVLTRLHEP
jgi:hypothetical protein